MLRKFFCKDVNNLKLGSKVKLCGWIHCLRDHGGISFIDLRDESGLLQIVVEESEENQTKLPASNFRLEMVIMVEGILRNRSEDTVNHNLLTGKFEIAASKIVILNDVDNLPFSTDTHQDISEEVLLKYRYLNFRLPKSRNLLFIRSQASFIVHKFMRELGFWEINTPILTRSTPEGARDFIVPSRLKKGNFYALPQSPQLFKQMIVIGGIEKYFQIVRCFRDEDLRADRQPEFTQIDIEAAFVEESDIMKITESLIKNLFFEIKKIQLNDFPSMSWEEADLKYCSDKPDLRADLQFSDILDLVKDCEFKVFSSVANRKDTKVVALVVPGGDKLTRKQIDDYTEYVVQKGAKGLAYIKIQSIEKGLAGLQSPIIKFLGFDICKKIIERTKAKDGDLIFFGAGHRNLVNATVGPLRVKIAKDINLFVNEHKPVWIVDFPLFEKDSDGKLQSNHHPFVDFTGTIEDCKNNPLNVKAKAYDLVIDGYEVGGGSLRIHKAKIQKQILSILNIDEKTQLEEFGFFLNALNKGCPPHGGIALGFDRIIMLLGNVDNMREVIPFPKTQSGICPLTNAPSTINTKDLLELGIKNINY